MIPEAVVRVGAWDASCDVEVGATVAYGRNSPSEQPEASTANLDFLAVDRASVELLAINETLTIHARFSDGEVARFVGRITDVAISWDTVDLANVKVIAAADMARLGRTFIGDVPYPQEIDGARATRILTQTVAPVNQIDPGTVQILPRDVDKQPILTLLTELADDAGAVAWHKTTGEVCYADAEHRRNTPVSVTLDCSQVLMSPTWILSTDGIVNDVTVTYGATPEGEEQPSVKASSAESIAAFGRWETSTATQLAALADATARANATIARSSYPAWNLPDVPLELWLPSLSEALTRAILKLQMHDLITVTGFPSQGPATTATLWVEGWEESIGVDSWEIALHVSAYCRSSAYVRWDDVLPEIRWDDLKSTWRWDDMHCMGPPVQAGRWNDVPANTRWNDVPPSVTWNTWNDYVGGG